MTAPSTLNPFPSFLPPAVQQLTEATSIQMAQQISQVAVPTLFCDRPIPTTYVRQGQGQPPLLLLHGFDSSLLEFRRLLPHLAAFRETWAIDLLGFGFTDRTCTPTLTPETIKQHLYAFCQTVIGQPVILVGASMGGAAAIDMALTYPDTVVGVVLIDSAGLAAAPAMDKLMFPPLDRWATAFLKNPGVRRRISQQAYADKRFVTPDAEVCAALHLACPRWSEALITFTKSGGYTLRPDQVAQLTRPTLILWGRQDRILGTQDAARFQAQITHSQLVWIENCGHVPHLEQAQATAIALREWLSTMAKN